MIRPSLLQTAAFALLVAEIALALAIWRLGPTGPIPMHFNAAGVVDRYGSRVDLALLTIGMTVFGAVCWLILDAMRRRAAAPNGIAWAQAVLLLAFAVIGIVFRGMAFDGVTSGPHNHAAILMVGLSLINLCVGAFLGKVGRNPFVGVRTFWSLSSRLSWEKSNRLAGRLLFWTGAVGLLASPFTPQPFGMTALLCAVIASALAAVFESWRVWRVDPERTAF